MSQAAGDLLGHGSYGTMVFRGSLDGLRPVAVKRLLSEYHATAAREIRLLIGADDHPNVVRYFVQEHRGGFVYLALELCAMTLHDAIQRVRAHQASNASSSGRAAAAAIAKVAGRRGRGSGGENNDNGDDNEVGRMLRGLPSGAVRGALMDIASGVAFLHEQRIVHRDIKPQNILLAPKDTWANLGLVGDATGAAAAAAGTTARAVASTEREASTSLERRA